MERRIVCDLDDGGRRLVSRLLEACLAATTSRSCASESEVVARVSLFTKASCWPSVALVASRAENHCRPLWSARPRAGIVSWIV